MTPSDLTIEILRGIQAGIAGLRDDVNARLDELSGRVGEHGGQLAELRKHAESTTLALEKLHAGQVLTNETLGLISERLRFAAAAAPSESEGWVRLEKRVDRLEGRTSRLEGRLGPDPTSD